MKNCITILLFIFSGIIISEAQTVISSSGKAYSNNYAKIDYTVGEIIISSHSTQTTDITQGFHQPRLKITEVVDLPLDFDIKVFPNPTEQYIQIEFNKKTKNYSFEIFDVNQKLIIRQDIHNLKTTIDISQYATAIYFLRILNNHQNRVKVYKIIKTI